MKPSPGLSMPRDVRTSVLCWCAQALWFHVVTTKAINHYSDVLAPWNGIALDTDNMDLVDVVLLLTVAFCGYN